MNRRLLMLLLWLSALTLSAQQYELAKTARGTKEQLIRHTGFTVSYNSAWLEPNWVAWELTREETSGIHTRSGVQFGPDPAVRHSATTYDYSRSGYSRGHMAPAGDMKWSADAMEQCFYLTNICPQDKTLNGGEWEKLESRSRGWAKQHGKVWICCGPIVERRPKTIGDDHVAVPKSFFKVLCMERKGRYYAIGFIIPNDPLQDSFWQYAKTVDEVEELTGHDFFCNLPDDIENEIEAKVNLAVWKGN